MLQLTVSRANNLILLLISILIGVMSYVEYLDYKKYRNDLDLKNRYIIGNTLIEAAVDLSLERSITQVANSLPGSIP